MVQQLVQIEALREIGWTWVPPRTDSLPAPLLAIGGFAFPFNNGALLALLEPTLLLLLVWVGVFAGLVARRSPTESGPEARVATT